MTTSAHRGWTSRIRARWSILVRSEEGSSNLSMTMLYPVILLLIFAIMQGALYMHGQNIARHAANGAVQTARIQGGTDAEGRQTAGDRLQAGDGVLSSTSVSISRDATSVTATVSGRVQSMIPLIPDLRVTQSATGPIERWVPR